MNTKRAGIFSQAVDAKLDYHVDWSDLLGADTIQQSTWDVPSGLVSSNPAFTATTAVIWLEGGVSGESYEVTNTIVTAAGREDSRHIVLMVI